MNPVIEVSCPQGQSEGTRLARFGCPSDEVNQNPAGVAQFVRKEQAPVVGGSDVHRLNIGVITADLLVDDVPPAARGDVTEPHGLKGKFGVCAWQDANAPVGLPGAVPGRGRASSER